MAIQNRPPAGPPGCQLQQLGWGWPQRQLLLGRRRQQRQQGGAVTPAATGISYTAPATTGAAPLPNQPAPGQQQGTAPSSGRAAPTWPGVLAALMHPHRLLAGGQPAQHLPLLLHRADLGPLLNLEGALHTRANRCKRHGRVERAGRWQAAAGTSCSNERGPRQSSAASCAAVACRQRSLGSWRAVARRNRLPPPARTPPPPPPPPPAQRVAPHRLACSPVARSTTWYTSLNWPSPILRSTSQCPSTTSPQRRTGAIPGVRRSSWWLGMRSEGSCSQLPAAAEGSRRHCSAVATGESHWTAPQGLQR